MTASTTARVRATSLAIVCLLVIAGCADPVTSPVDTRPEAPYATFVVASQLFVDERLIDGRLEGQQQAMVTAQVPGQVIAVLQDIEAEVGAGVPVLRLRTTQAQGGLGQAEAALREAEAFAVEAEARYQRISGLFARQVVPRATYEQAQAQRDSARARRDSAAVARDAASAYTWVPAPFAGTITERVVRVGDTVAPGMPLFGIAGGGALRVRAELPESLVAATRELREVVVYHRQQRLTTRDVRVYGRADTRDGSFGLQADLSAPVSGLDPGRLVKLGVVVGERQGVRIPRASVVERGEVTGVYVHSVAGTRFRQVRLGAVTGEHVEVLAGLAPGEQVAQRPADALAVMRGLPPGNR